MPKPNEDKAKKDVVIEDMASDEALKAADEAVKDDVKSMLDDMLDEEKEEDKKSDEEEEEDSKKKSEEEEESEEDEEEDKDEKDEDDEGEDEEEEEGDDKEEEDEDKEDEDKEEEKDEDKKKPVADIEVATTIARLEGRIEELSKTAQAKEKEEKDEGPAIDPIEFISKDTDLTEHPLTTEEMNKLLNQARLSAYEEMVRNTPKLVTTLVEGKITLDKAVDGFYEENEDLAPIKDYVGSVANMVVSENPDWAIDKVLEETEKRVRKNLDLEKKAKDTHEKTKKKKDKDEEESDDTKKKNPLASKRGGKSGRKGEDTRSDEQRDIDDIVS